MKSIKILCKSFLLPILLLLLPGQKPAVASENPLIGNGRTIVDHRGVSITLPKALRRVVTISDGFVEEVMTIFQVQKLLVGLGSPGLSSRSDFSHETVSGKPEFYRNGMNTATLLNSWLMKLPILARPGTGVNYEALAGLNPDLVIVQLGACALLAHDEKTRKSMQTITRLGIPVVVLIGPNAINTPQLELLFEQIRILGQVFDKSLQAEALVQSLKNPLNLVQKRTQGIAENRKPRLLFLGLAPGARSAGGAGYVRGSNTSDAWLLEKVVNARNAYCGNGIWNILNTEQMLALDPDALLLITSQGYHPASELFNAPYCQPLSELSAVKNRRVAALAYTPLNCEKRLEFPIDLMIMAKTAYPERFNDIQLDSWILDFYQQIYKVDRDTAKRLRAAQWLDWTVDYSKNEKNVKD